VGVFRVKGQPNLEIPVDPQKCNYWAISVDDVNDVVKTAVGGKPFTQIIEGEKRFDLSLRWPARLRSSEEDILNIPVDVFNNRVTESADASAGRGRGGAGQALSPLGSSGVSPETFGGANASASVQAMSQTPRRRLRDLVTPMDDEGNLDAKKGRFIRAGASTIYREEGDRMIAVKFSVRGRDLAGAVAEAQHKTADIFQLPYTTVWSGEFDQMKEAEGRLMVIIPISMLLVFMLLYLAFRSFLDTFAVLANVVALSMGGIWALLLTGTNFSISAAVGFISIFGVAIMDGLLLISYFNQLRYEGLALREAILQGAAKRVRPMMMTALTAILGLLPAAVSTKIGAQTQQPLAIVVVGGMIMTLVLNRYLMPVLYSYYGGREPSEHAGSMAH
jgi:cobalt-zinc-cadmium resistance protein CzcA